MTDDERFARYVDRLEQAVSDLAVTYDPRSRQSRDIADVPPRSRVTHVRIGPIACPVPTDHAAYVAFTVKRTPMARWDGLYAQLTRALGTAAVNERDEGRAGKPGSRPPGWRADVSALISTIETTMTLWKPGGRSTIEQLRNVPYVTPDELMRERGQVLAGFVSRATLAIGYRAPSKDLPVVVCRKRHLTRSGWREVGCGQVSLKVREGGSRVWCSTPSCHDSVLHPDCKQDTAGGWSCRDSDGDRTHAITFDKTEWLRLWERMDTGIDA